MSDPTSPAAQSAAPDGAEAAPRRFCVRCGVEDVDFAQRTIDDPMPCCDGEGMTIGDGTHDLCVALHAGAKYPRVTLVADDARDNLTLLVDEGDPDLLILKHEAGDSVSIHLDRAGQLIAAIAAVAPLDEAQAVPA